MRLVMVVSGMGGGSGNETSDGSLRNEWRVWE